MLKSLLKNKKVLFGGVSLLCITATAVVFAFPYIYSDPQPQVAQNVASEEVSAEPVAALLEETGSENQTEQIDNDALPPEQPNGAAVDTDDSEKLQGYSAPTQKAKEPTKPQAQVSAAKAKEEPKSEPEKEEKQPEPEKDGSIFTEDEEYLDRVRDYLLEAIPKEKKVGEVHSPDHNNYWNVYAPAED